MNKSGWIKLFVIFFCVACCGCAVPDKVDKAKETSKGDYTLEKVSDQKVFGVTVSVGETDSGYYVAMRDKSQGTSIYFYDAEFTLRERIPLEQMDGYDVRKLSLGQEEKIYAFLAATDAEKSQFTGFLLAVYDKNGKITDQVDVTQIVFEELGEKPVFLNALLKKNGEFILPVTDPSGRESLTIISPKGAVVKRIPLEGKEDAKKTQEHITEIKEQADGVLLVLIREEEYGKENGAYSIYKVDLLNDQFSRIWNGFQ